MNNFSKAFTITTIFVGCSMQAADKSNIVERYVGASEVTFTETIFEKNATIEREATKDKKNKTFKAKLITYRLYRESLEEELENPEDIFGELEEKHRKQENKKGPGDETNITNPDNKKRDPVIVDEWKHVKEMGPGRGIKVYHTTVHSFQGSDGKERQILWKYTVDDD